MTSDALVPFAAFPAFFLDVLLQSAVVMIGAFALCAAQGRGRPAMRAGILAGGLVLATALPLAHPCVSRPLSPAPESAGPKTRAPLVAAGRPEAAAPETLVTAAAPDARPGDPAAPVGVAPSRAGARKVAHAPVPVADAAPAATVASPSPRPLAGLLLAAVWALGAGIVLARAVLGHLRVRRLLADTRAPDAAEAAWWREVHGTSGLGREVRLRISSRIAAPLVTGPLFPTVVIPDGLRARLGASAAHAVALHELMHVARGDLLVQLLLLVPRALLWPNPLVALANRRWCEAREILADREVVRRTGAGADYAAGIVATLAAAGRGARHGATAMGLADGGVRALKRRIDLILAPAVAAPSARARRVATGAALPVLAAFSAMLGVGAGVQDEAAPLAVVLTEPWPDRAVLETEEGHAAWTPARLRAAGRVLLEGEEILPANLEAALRKAGEGQSLVVTTHPQRAWSDVAAVLAAAEAAGIPEARRTLKIEGASALGARPARADEAGEVGVRIERVGRDVVVTPPGAAVAAETPAAADGDAPVVFELIGALTVGDVARVVAARDLGGRPVIVRVGAPAARTAPAPGAAGLPRAEDYPPVSQDALTAALTAGGAWLAGQQRSDGTWTGPMKDADAGYTGMAVLALAPVAGQVKNRFGEDAVDAGVAALMRMQRADGAIGGAEATRNYQHAFATMALVAACETKQRPHARRAAENAITYIVKAQNPHSGWRYGVRDGESDSSVTGFLLAALLRARAAGFAVPQETVDAGLAFLDRMTDPETGRTGYVTPGSVSSRANDEMTVHPPARSENLTALALLVRGLVARDTRTEVVTKGLTLLRKSPPVWDADGEEIDPIYWRNGAEATFAWGANPRDVWERALAAALLPRQALEGEDAGSWPAVGAWSGSTGRVGVTALALMALRTLDRR